MQKKKPEERFRSREKGLKGKQIQSEKRHGKEGQKMNDS